MGYARILCGRRRRRREPAFRQACVSAGAHPSRRQARRSRRRLMADWNDPNGAYLFYYKGSGCISGAGRVLRPRNGRRSGARAAAYGSTAIASPLVRLYALAKTPAYGSLFHDITSGCNGLNGVPGFARRRDTTVPPGSAVYRRRAGSGVLKSTMRPRAGGALCASSFGAF